MGMEALHRARRSSPRRRPQRAPALGLRPCVFSGWALCQWGVMARLLGGSGLMGVSLLSQMLQDCPKARREVELHWRASQCAHIVRIMDVYENLYQGRKCLLIVMEW